MHVLKKDSPEKVYRSLAPSRKELVFPRLTDPEEFIQEWISAPYETKGYYDESTPALFTQRNERVRSKSEVLLATLLDKLQIPYKYEKRTVLENGYAWYPDFTVLSPVTLKEVIIEHFGMMDDIEYAENALGKLDIYNRNGYFLGENLLITMETRSHPLNLPQTELMLRHYLL